MPTVRARLDQLSHGPKESAIAPIPRGAKIGLTSRCNFKCEFCAHAKMAEHGDMDWPTYELIAKKLRAAGLTHIGLFFLGESFILDWLPEAIAYAVELGYTNVFLTTNGSLSTPDAIHACMKAGLHSLKFSLNYADANQMKAITGVKPRIFSDVETNIIAARAIRDRQGFNCQLSASYIAYDAEQGERMRKRAAKMAPYLDQPAYPLPLYNQAGHVENLGRGNPGHVDNPVPIVPCWVLWGQAHVTHEGKLSACCFDHASTFIMGDLRTQTFEEAWNSAEFQTLRQAHLDRRTGETACAECVGPTS